MWEGGDVWIIGGGPSIPKQFDVPDDVIQQVISGALPPNAYSPYMEAIHKKHVIGINMAYKLGNWIDMVVFGDSGFYLREKVGLSQFQGLRVSCHDSARHDKWVKTLSRDSSHPKGISSSPSMISWNGNTGAAAISIAVHAGAARIILLGFDMNIDARSQMQHWHNLYGKGPVQDDRRRRKLPFPRHLTGFTVIADDVKKLGVQIINASPNSAIQCFPKMTVKEILAETVNV